MLPTLRQCECFVVLAEELHFGHAAARLGIAQPPLSIQIRKLEEAVGAPLVDRTTRAVSLTEAGAAFASVAGEVVDVLRRGVEDARRAAAGELGTLTVGYAGSAMFTEAPERIRGYRDAHPLVRLRMVELPSLEHAGALLAGAIDVAITRDPVEAPGVTPVPFVVESFVVALPADHVLARGRRPTLTAVAAEPLILFPRAAHPGIHDRLWQSLSQVATEPCVVQETSEWLTAVALVGAGMGIAFVPESFRRYHRDRVVYRTVAELPLQTAVAVSHRAGDRSALVRDFAAAFSPQSTAGAGSRLGR